MTGQAASIKAVDVAAERLLSAADRAGYCVPGEHRPGVQHGLTSTMVAIAFAAGDARNPGRRGESRDAGLSRAWLEIETLFGAQWTNGMLPALVYWGEDPAPDRTSSLTGARRVSPAPLRPDLSRTRDPEGGPDAPETAGFTAPPFSISCARLLWDLDGEGRYRDRLAALYPRLSAWRDWFRATRLVAPDGPVFVVDPRESGRETAPEWDARPGLGQPGDGAGAFRVADPGATFALARAERDLAALARALGREAEADALEAAHARLLASADSLWNESANCYCVRDLAGDGALHDGALHDGALHDRALHDGVASPAFLAWYGGLPADDHRSPRLLATFERALSRVEFGVPSYDPGSVGFQGERPWRGAVGVTMNYLIALGLADIGETRLAARLRLDARRLIQNAGFLDWFDPWTAQLERRPTPRTAALWLAWASPNAPRDGRWARVAR